MKAEKGIDTAYARNVSSCCCMVNGVDYLEHLGRSETIMARLLRHNKVPSETAAFNIVVVRDHRPNSMCHVIAPQKTWKLLSLETDRIGQLNRTHGLRKYVRSVGVYVACTEMTRKER
jgi:hypothetical protein